MGSLYIPPVAPENLALNLQQQQQQQTPPQGQWVVRQKQQPDPNEDEQQLLKQQTPTWMASKQNMDAPDWAVKDNNGIVS